MSKRFVFDVDDILFVSLETDKLCLSAIFTLLKQSIINKINQKVGF